MIQKLILWQICIVPVLLLSNYGRVARRGQFPYLVGFQDPVTRDRFSGALISDRYILTLADMIPNKGKLNVYIGAHIIAASKEVGRINYVINVTENVVVFPEYIKGIPIDNLAIVSLPQPVDSSDFIGWINLPQATDVNNTFDEAMVNIAGWNTRQPSRHLSQAINHISVTVLPHDDCRKLVPLESVQICIDNDLGRYRCQGDPGAPIATVVQGEPVVIGLLNPSLYCASYEPQVGLRVSSYLSWISEITNITIH